MTEQPFQKPLSDAMLEGAVGQTLRPDQFVQYLGEEEGYAVCALGAALRGWYEPDLESLERESEDFLCRVLEDTYPFLSIEPRALPSREHPFTLPECGCNARPTPILNWIAHVFDKHAWTVERIAAFLREHGQ